MSAAGAMMAVASLFVGCAEPPSAPAPSTCETSVDCFRLHEEARHEVLRCTRHQECVRARAREHIIAEQLARLTTADAERERATAVQVREQARAETEGAAASAANTFLEEEAKQRARWRDACAADREDRARQHSEIADAARVAKAGRAILVAEAEKLRSFQRSRCRKVTERQTERVACDDGSDVVKICEVPYGRPETFYVCPQSAPAAIRGEHELTRDPYDRDAPLAGGRVARDVHDVYREGGRVVQMVGRDSTGPSALEERDQQCATFDREADLGDAGGAP